MIQTNRSRNSRHSVDLFVTILYYFFIANHWFFSYSNLPCPLHHLILQLYSPYTDLEYYTLRLSSEVTRFSSRRYFSFFRDFYWLLPQPTFFSFYSRNLKGERYGQSRGPLWSGWLSWKGWCLCWSCTKSGSLSFSHGETVAEGSHQYKRVFFL